MRKKANIFFVTMVLIAIVCTSVIYQIWKVHVPKAKNNPIEQTVQEAIVTNHSAEQQIQAFVWPKIQPYEGERRYPVVKKTPHPIPKYKSDIYLEYNTSRYIDDNGLIYIPSDEVLGNMTRNELTELYYSYIENIQVTCPRMRHVGNDRDGGYHVCEPALPRDCLAYSFGNRKDYSFDDGLAFHYNCEVHSFDPNDGQPDHRHGELVEFHKLGIGGRDEIINYNWTLKTLDSIRMLLGHEDRPLDLLKIDIEGGEWSCFPQMLLSNVLGRAHVKLLMVEFHMRFIKQNKAAYLNGLHILKGIYDAGFRIYFFRIWTLLCQQYDKITVVLYRLNTKYRSLLSNVNNFSTNLWPSTDKPEVLLTFQDNHVIGNQAGIRTITFFCLVYVSWSFQWLSQKGIQYVFKRDHSVSELSDNGSIHHVYVQDAKTMTSQLTC